MSRIIGRLTSIGAAKEAVRGTALAPTFWIPVRDLDFDDQLEKKSNESGYGVISQLSDADVIKQWSEGSFGGKIMDRSIGLILTALFGSSPTSVQRATSGVYDHTYAMANNNSHQSLCLAIKEANQNLRYANAVLDSFKLEAVLDDYVRYEANFVGKKGASASDTVSYLTTENEFVPKHMAITLATNLAGLPGSSIGLRSITLEINKNAEGLQVLGSNDLDDVANKEVEVSGSMELYYNNTTQRSLVYDNSNRAMRIQMINTALDLGSGHNPELRFDLAKVNFTNYSRGYDQGDIMTETIDFEGHYSLSDAAQIAARLTNAYAGTNY